MTDQAKYFVKKISKAWRALLIRDQWWKRIFYLQCDYPGELLPDKKGVLLKEIDLYLGHNSFDFIFKQYSIVRILRKHLNAKFYCKGDDLFITFNNVTFNITTAEEIFILEEVFVVGSYNFKNSKPVIVVDVGMNVGAASLFFASQREVLKVYSFEPFDLTYKQALKNLEYNPDLKSKIKTHLFGLSDTDGTKKVTYNYENKGQVGIYGTSLIRSSMTKEEVAFIELKKSSEQLRKIIDENSAYDIVLKLDSEGAEYSIINDLKKHNLLAAFKIIFIEWHENGPNDLVEALVANGFVVLYNQAVSKKVGMIYAAK